MILFRIFWFILYGIQKTKRHRPKTIFQNINFKNQNVTMLHCNILKYLLFTKTVNINSFIKIITHI